jgi:plastocyanin
MRKIMLLLTLLSLAAFTACGGGDSGIPPLPAAPAGATGGGGNEIPLNSTVKGKITWEGAAPVAKKIQTTADPGCKNTDLVSEETVVSDGGLENVILYVSGGDIAGKKFAARRETVELDQLGCHYVPHALTVQIGQELLIKNSDDTAHNVHAWSEANPPFNEAQAHKGDEKRVKFEKEEMHFPIRCDVHNWMNAFVGVFNHPLHTVSKKGGAFELKMAAGTYEITAIHEKWGEQKKMVEVTDGGSVDLNFTFKGDGKGN